MESVERNYKVYSVVMQYFFCDLAKQQLAKVMKVYV